MLVCEYISIYVYHIECIIFKLCDVLLSQEKEVLEKRNQDLTAKATRLTTEAVSYTHLTLPTTPYV